MWVGSPPLIHKMLPGSRVEVTGSHCTKWWLEIHHHGFGPHPYWSKAWAIPKEEIKKTEFYTCSWKTSLNYLSYQVTNIIPPSLHSWCSISPLFFALNTNLSEKFPQQLWVFPLGPIQLLDYKLHFSFPWLSLPIFCPISSRQDLAEASWCWSARLLCASSLLIIRNTFSRICPEKELKG